MKKFLLKLGLADPEVHIPSYQPCEKTKPSIDIEAFTKWSADLNVSIMVRSTEFTVRIGDHIKYVSLSDRF
jgi:hypothetical protein